MFRAARTCALVALFTGLPGASLAASVFVNGVNIDSLRNQRYEHAVVEIDASGNIHITTMGPKPGPAPAPAVAPAPTTPAPPVVPTAITKRYYLVTEKAAPGMSQYDLDLFVNGKWLRRLLDIEEHIVLELTPNLKPGPNTITILAKKNMGTERRSSSPQHFFRVVIGEGNEGGRNVMISKKFIDYRRTALETKDTKDEFTLVGQ